MAVEGIQGNTYHYRPRAVVISISGIFPIYLLKPWVNLYVHPYSEPPTHTDSSVFIRILRGIYGHTDTTRHYTEARFRHQAQDMLLVDLVAVSVRPTETFL